MKNDDDGAIAIVAMECRIPEADNVDKLWELLLQGRCTIHELSDEQMAEAGVPASQRSHPDYVKRAGVLEDVDKFDEDYFEMSAREAEVLDVQQRMMLEAAVTLLNRGNVDPGRTDQRVGVFAGSAFSSYLFGVIEQGELVDTLGEMLVRHSNDKDFLAPRISYKLNLDGPSLNVQTSCSTGLVAVHSAAQSLLLGECDLAIAGAVCIKLPQHAGYKYQADGVLSPDGLCRPFDAESKGTIFTNGLGLVLLKRLSEAVEDGDDVIAVIAGSAINNDGSKKVGFTAPSVSGQIDALTRALAVAGIAPAEVQFIEAHGTGTAMGDPIEVEAIKQAYGIAGQPCGIGSLKGNFGHFNIAAGIIGLIKTALVLKHGIIPATIHVQRVNPQLGLEGSRFYVTDRNVTLDIGSTRYAAVSAFGMGGTNSHLVLRSYDASPQVRATPDDRPQLFTFSAKSGEVLDRMAVLHANHFESAPYVSLADASYTARVTRPVFQMRSALVARNAGEAAARLKSGDFRRGDGSKRPPLAFVFGGQGTQHISMGQDLARHWAPFKRQLDLALVALSASTQLNLASYLWQPSHESDITSTDIAQPLIFAVEYALACSLLEVGISPSYLMGHSLGEVVAAAVSGVFDLQTAAAVVARRARLMASCEPGAMLSVDSLSAFESLIAVGELTIASNNSPRQYVVSGSIDRIEEAVRLAQTQGIAHQRLKTSHAFHSPMMRTAAQELLSFLSSIAFGTARIPIVSNITGRLLTEYEYKNPAYWSDHLVRTVQFAVSVDTLSELGVRHFIEVGHGYAMSNLIRANFRNAAAKDVVIVQALGGAEDEYASYLDAVALAWTLSFNVAVDPHISGKRRVKLPVYPFARKSHWVKPVIGFQPRVVGRDPLCLQPIPLNAITTCEAAVSANQVRAPEDHQQPSDPQSASEDNPVEAIVADIYRAFLGDEDLDRDLTFFELGGNSLVAIQMINRLRETFQIDIPLRGFYQHSSIAAISHQIAEKLLEEPANV